MVDRIVPTSHQVALVALWVRSAHDGKNKYLLRDKVTTCERAVLVGRRPEQRREVRVDANRRDGDGTVWLSGEDATVNRHRVVDLRNTAARRSSSVCLFVCF